MSLTRAFLGAEYMPDKSPPFSPTDETAEGDVFLPDGTPAKFTKPQALDQAGINQVFEFCHIDVPYLDCQGP